MNISTHPITNAIRVSVFAVAVLSLPFIGTKTAIANSISVDPMQIRDSWLLENAPVSNLRAGNFSIVPGNTTEIRSSDAASKISDFEVSGDFVFRSGFHIDNPGDDDLIGFYFGFQDMDNHYRFGWDAFDRVLMPPAGVGDNLGDNGVANVAGIPGVHGLRVIREVDGVNHFLYQDAPGSAVPWKRFTDYDITIGRTGDNLSVMVKELGGKVVLDQTFMDSTFRSGRVGIYSDSQFAGFFSDVSLAVVPEPSSIALAVLGLLGILAYRGRNLIRRRRS